MQIPILLRMNPGYGLGDNVCFSIVLRHLQKYRPNWTIDFISDRGKCKMAAGLVNRVWDYESADQPDMTRYKKSVHVYLFDNIHNWFDRPCTPAIACLHEKFGLSYDPTLGRYFIRVGEDVAKQASSLSLTQYGRLGRGFIGIHYAGNSNQGKKNLEIWQVEEIANRVRMFNYWPLMFDWDRPLDRQWLTINSAVSVRDTGLSGADAEHNAAVIDQCKAFIGIDSGPGKCASATDTPTAIIWTGHHPIHYHDPAPNTTHLIPLNHRELMPARGPDQMLEYFSQAYNSRVYANPVDEVFAWLSRLIS